MLDILIRVKQKRIFTPEHRAKLGLAKTGRIPWNKGKILSEIHRKNLSESHKGNISPNKGKKFPERSGVNCHLWKGGITPINVQIRHSVEYKLWRESVFKRDNYTCRGCGEVGGRLNADHIKPFAWFPELRFAIDNGQTLCIPCHKLTPTYGSKGKKLYA